MTSDGAVVVINQKFPHFFKLLEIPKEINVAIK